MKTIARALVALAALVAPVVVSASHSPDHALAAKPDTPLVAGEVRRIDKDAGKVTLKHEAIPNLAMTPMTMVFHVRDRAMLEALKPGDKVRFKAENVKGALTVTWIAPPK